VSVDHEHVQELLAGFALHALDPDRLRETEELRATHLPACDECRAALASFEATAGELGIAAGAKPPPRLLDRRLRRELANDRGRRWVAYLPVAASVVVASGLLMWNAQLTSRIGHAEQRQAASAELLTAVSHPASKVLPLPLAGMHTAATEAPAQLAAAVIPGRAVLYLFGSMPAPNDGRVYTVWLVRSGRYENVAAFVPEQGSVLLALRINPSGYERLLITEEEEGARKGEPSEDHLTEVAL
jgi:Anti-sigma-K factor rskA, C-terminal